MKSDAELNELKADMSAIMDKAMDSPEVKKWTNRVLAVKDLVPAKKH